MALYKTITDSGHYFITMTCYKWIPLIALTNGYDAIYKWFNLLGSKGNPITGYVIMPNHLHFLIYYTQTDQSLNKILGTGKRFLAYEFVKRLKSLDRNKILSILSEGVQKKINQEENYTRYGQGLLI